MRGLVTQLRGTCFGAQERRCPGFLTRFAAMEKACGGDGGPRGQEEHANTGRLRRGVPGVQCAFFSKPEGHYCALAAFGEQLLDALGVCDIVSARPPGGFVSHSAAPSPARPNGVRRMREEELRASSGRRRKQQCARAGAPERFRL